MGIKNNALKRMKLSNGVRFLTIKNITEQEVLKALKKVNDNRTIHRTKPQP